MDSKKLLSELSRPFSPSSVTAKPGAVSKDKPSALALAYADLRAYQNRLDELCGLDWSVTYSPWGDKLICHLTINGVTRSSTGEPDSQSERSEIAGTASEAQAFKRACAMFGLGRYLYSMPSVWLEYDKDRRLFTDAGRAKFRGIIEQHYKRWEATRQADFDEHEGDDKQTSDALSSLVAAIDNIGAALSGDEWPTKRAEIIASVGKRNNLQASSLADLGEKRLDFILKTLEERAAEQAKSQSADDKTQRPKWSGPSDAQAWAVAERKVADKSTALELWKNIVANKFAGKMTSDVMPQALDEYYKVVSMLKIGG